MNNKINHKRIIYQVFTRLFGNNKYTNLPNGTLEQNGCGKFNDFTPEALKSIAAMGITDIWYTGIIHHAQLTDYSAYGIPKDHPSIVKGIAGSPYAIKDYYDVDPDLAVHVPHRMKEFESLVARTHEHNLKVIIDFVPNHVARQYKSNNLPPGLRDLGQDDQKEYNFQPQNNFYYLGTPFTPPFEEQNMGLVPYEEFPARATGNDVFSPNPSINDWYETIKLNYGVDYENAHQKHVDPIPSTWIKMKDILLFWAGKNIDGFRCDMVEMVPVEFWGWAIQQVKAQYPDVIFIAEIYNPTLYHSFIEQGKFDYLYDKVGLYNRLRPLVEGNGNAEDLTWLWQNESGNISHHMVRFLENHDEQRIASKFFAGDPFKALPAVTLSATMHTGPFMIYFGQELGVNSSESEGFQGDDGRTTIFDYWGIPEIQQWSNGGRYDEAALISEQLQLRHFYSDLCQFITNSPAITHGQFFDLQYVNNRGQSRDYNETKIYSYLRYTDTEQLLCIYNFDQHTLYNTFIKIPQNLIEEILLVTENDLVSLQNVITNTRIEEIKKIKVSDASMHGIPVNLLPNSVNIFRLKAERITSHPDSEHSI